MKIGFIGLGNVGGKLAGSVLRNGFDLTVCDLSDDAAAPLVEAGAKRADSAKDLTESSDVIITCLPSPKVSAAVLEDPDGVISGMGPGKIWLEMSTTEASEVKRLASLVEGTGARAMDTPVSGGCHRAATGNIAIFAGGERDVFEEVMPVLAVMGRDIVHTGPLGSASVLKVITNYLAGVQLVSTGEAFMVAKQAGIDLGVAYDAIRVSSGNSFVHETEGQVILNGSYNINFTMDHELKDMRLFDDLANSLDVPVDLSPVIVSVIADGLERYGSRAWSSSVVRRLEDACGSELRADGFPSELFDSEPEVEGREISSTTD